jgi:hypothetical protein
MFAGENTPAATGVQEACAAQFRGSGIVNLVKVKALP